jgi:hypothetical protein
MMSNEEQPRKLAKPTVFDQLYAGRFLKAGELLGKKVTLTMSSVDLEELQGDDGAKKAKAIISFKETEKKLVACKTNGISIKAMFGPKLADWVGKRVTIFPDTWNGEGCIRVWGSPDIAQDVEVEISLPRRRPFKKTMHKMGTKPVATSPSPPPADTDGHSDAADGFVSLASEPGAE